MRVRCYTGASLFMQSAHPDFQQSAKFARSSRAMQPVPETADCIGNSYLVKAKTAQINPESANRQGLRIFQWGWTAFMVLATSFPYFLNYVSTPKGYRYTWILPPYP